jgi:hypothetical protein
MVHPSTASLRSTFTGFSTLTHLVIDADFFAAWDEIRSIELPLLRCLHLIPSEDSHLISGMLLTISAPSLQHLLLENLFAEDILNLMDSDLSFKYPSLRSLTILPQLDVPSSNFTLANWRLLIAIFPITTHVTLSESYSGMDTFLKSLDEQTYPLEYPVESPLWPTLHTLTLLDQPRELDVALLRTAVSTRITLGRPIRKLQLSRAIMHMLTDEMQWLQTHVEVEECTVNPKLIDTYIANWPDGNY